jgi:hypothetical protein
VGALRVEPHLTTPLASRQGTALCEALQLGCIRPSYPPLALLMPAGMESSAFAPLMQRRIRLPHLPLHVRQPPLVRLQEGTAVPPRLLHPSAPHQLDNRLAAAWPGMFGRPASLVCQHGHDLCDMASLWPQCPDTLTQAWRGAQVCNVTHGTGGPPGRAPAPAPCDRHLEPCAPPFAGHEDAVHALSANLCTLRHRRSGRMPPRGTMLRSLLDGLPYRVGFRLVFRRNPRIEGPLPIRHDALLSSP